MQRFLQHLALGTADLMMPHYKARNVFAELKKLGIALLGLGNYSNIQLAPALLETEYCRLVGIVTGTPA